MVLRSLKTPSVEVQVWWQAQRRGCWLRGASPLSSPTTLWLGLEPWAQRRALVVRLEARYQSGGLTRSRLPGQDESWLATLRDMLRGGELVRVSVLFAVEHDRC
jgi:hypothetical protein